MNSPPNNLISENSEGEEKCAMNKLRSTHGLSDTSDQYLAGTKENKKNLTTESSSTLMVKRLRELRLLPPLKDKYWDNDEYCAQVANLCDLFVSDITLLVDPQIVQMMSKNYPFVQHYMDTLFEHGRCTMTQHRLLNSMVSTYLDNYAKWAEKKKADKLPHISCLKMKNWVEDRGMDLKCHACPNYR